MSKPVTDKGPWSAFPAEYIDLKRRDAFLESDDFTHDVRLYINGDFADDGEEYEYAKWLAAVLNLAGILNNEANR